VSLPASCKIIWTFLIFYITLLPYYYLPYVSFGNYKLPVFKYLPLACIALLGFFSFTKHNLKAFHLTGKRISLGIALYFLTTLLAGFRTPQYALSLVKALYYGTTGILLYFIVSSWSLRKKDIEFMLKVIIAAAVAISMYGLMSLAIGKNVIFAHLPATNYYLSRYIINPIHDIHLPMGRISSTLGNPHFVGTVLSPALLFSLYFWLRSEKRGSSFYFAFASFCILSALILTFSMAAYVFLLVVAVYFIRTRRYWSLSVHYRQLRKLITFILSVSGLFILLILLGFILKLYIMNLPLPDALGKFNLQVLVSSGGISCRWESIKLALKFWNVNYGLGMGIGSVAASSLVYPRVAMDNFYCLSLVEYGLIPTLCMLYMLGFFFYGMYRRASQAHDGDPLISVVLLGWVSFLIAMLVWDTLSHPTMRIIFWSLAGLMVGTVFATQTRKDHV